MAATSEPAGQSGSRRASGPPAILSPTNLRETAAWICDVLDPLVAQEGPNELHPDDVLTLHTLLLSLQKYAVAKWTLRYSRIGRAILAISGKCTRWPAKLADEADNCVEHLERMVGKLTELDTPLYEKGGRLYCICEPEDITRDSLLKRFASHNPSFVDNSRAYFHGDLGFMPGHWWINGMFAFREGIIDDRSTDGGICYNDTGAYAIVMSNDDEICEPTPERFTYVCNNSDRGRFRLTAADFKARHPIRILRSHAMKSLWNPRVGLRYEGLHVHFRYKVVGWTCKPIKAADYDGVPLQYLVRFERDDPVPMSEVFTHPNAEDFDDYAAYKRSIREQRDAEKEGAEILHSRNKSTEQHTTRMKLQDGDEHDTKAGSQMNMHGAVDVTFAESSPGDFTPQQEPSDGLGQLFRSPAMRKGIRGKSKSHSHSYDGSYDEPNTIDSCFYDEILTGNPKTTPAVADNDKRRGGLAGGDESAQAFSARTHTHGTTTWPDVWKDLFTEVEWMAGRAGTRGRKFNEDAKVSASIDPTADKPFTTAEARGEFEMARARKPLPANAPAFLAALERVYHDIAMPDYVAKTVVKETSI